MSDSYEGISRIYDLQMTTPSLKTIIFAAFSSARKPETESIDMYGHGS